MNSPARWRAVSGARGKPRGSEARHAWNRVSPRPHTIQLQLRPQKKQAGIAPACSRFRFANFYFAAALTAVIKFAPFGVPSPVTLSYPGPVVSEVSVPKLITYHRVVTPL